MKLAYLPKPNPTGTELVRLDTVPLEDRQAALHECIAKGDITLDEVEGLLEFICNPGDHSTRVAA